MTISIIVYVIGYLISFRLIARYIYYDTSRDDKLGTIKSDNLASAVFSSLIFSFYWPLIAIVFIILFIWDFLEEHLAGRRLPTILRNILVGKPNKYEGKR